MFGGMGGDFMKQMKAAQEIAGRTKTLQDDLANTLITGSTGPVEITMTATQSPKSVALKEDYSSMSKEELEKAITGALIDSHDRAVRMAEEKMKALYTEFGIAMPPPQ